MDEFQFPQHPALPAHDEVDGGEDVGARRCARCRVVFEDMPTLDIRADARNEWSLCPSCQPLAFPTRTRGTAKLTVVRDSPT